MGSISAVDTKTGRKFYLDDPDDLKPGDRVVFLLSLHGGGSVGAWQRAYFPAFQYKEKYRLVIATPSYPTYVGPSFKREWRGAVERVEGFNATSALISVDSPDHPSRATDFAG